MANFTASPADTRAQYAQCKRAFFQNPTPALGAALKRLENALKREKHFYFVEITDTFAGEANYSWVRRYKVKASSMRGAVSKVSKDSGYQGALRKTGDYGDMTRHDISGMCVCIFTSDFDADSHGSYNLIEI